MTLTPVTVVKTCTAIHLHPMNILVSAMYDIDLHQNSMTIYFEDLAIPRKSSIFLIRDLCLHESKLFVDFVRRDVVSNLCEFSPCFLYVTLLYEFTGTLRHIRSQTHEEDNTPGSLECKWQTPLQGAIWCITTCKSDPIGCQCPSRNPNTGNASDQPTGLWSADFREVDGNSGTQGATNLH